MPTYRIAGLAVGSELPLPGVLPIEAAAADVTVRRRPVPEALEAPSAQTPFWQIQEDHFLLVLPGIGRFLAVAGRDLDMDPAPGTDPADSLPFLLGTGIGVILHQRGALVLHAATVERNGRAYAFCGQSGIGKSTLAASLCGAGCRLLADDVSAVLARDDGAPVIASDGRRLKLFARTIERLGLQERMGDPVRAGIGKHYVAPQAEAEAPVVPLAAIYRLRRRPPGDPLRIARLSPLVAAQTLHQNTYRRRLALAYAADGRAVALTAAVVRRVPVFVMAQPEDLTALPGTVEDLLARWDGPEG